MVHICSIWGLRWAWTPMEDQGKKTFWDNIYSSGYMNVQCLFGDGRTLPVCFGTYWVFQASFYPLGHQRWDQLPASGHPDYWSRAYKLLYHPQRHSLKYRCRSPLLSIKWLNQKNAERMSWSLFFFFLIICERLYMSVSRRVCESVFARSDVRVCTFTADLWDLACKSFCACACA